MRQVKFRKGKHKPSPPRLGFLALLRPWRDVLWQQEYVVGFDQRAAYDHQGWQQLAWNKLFGLGLEPGVALVIALVKLFGGLREIRSPHVNSARWVWRWDRDRQQAQIAAYTYIDGSIQIEPICFLQTIVRPRLGLKLTRAGWIYTINGQVVHMVPYRPQLGDLLAYALMPYFGGSDPAPANISFIFEKAKP